MPTRAGASNLPTNQPTYLPQINEGNPVALNLVNEYVSLYTKDQLQLVPQEQPWGFTEQVSLPPPMSRI